MPWLSWRISPRHCIEDVRLFVNPRRLLILPCSVVFISVCNKYVILHSKWVTLNAAPCILVLYTSNVLALWIVTMIFRRCSKATFIIFSLNIVIYQWVFLYIFFFTHLNAIWISLLILPLISTCYFRIHHVEPPRHPHLHRTVCSAFQFLHFTHTDIFLRIVATMLDAQLFLQPSRVAHTEETNASNR